MDRKNNKKWIACGGVNFEDRREREGEKKGGREGGEFRKNNN